MAMGNGMHLRRTGNSSHEGSEAGQSERVRMVGVATDPRSERLPSVSVGMCSSCSSTGASQPMRPVEASPLLLLRWARRCARAWTGIRASSCPDTSTSP